MGLGDNRFEYNGKASTGKARLKTIKIHFNSTISTKDSKFAAANIKVFHKVKT